ncbi:DUF2835 family protein [Hahella sp. SMD15-11]|uniref:DUF2835 family protein n=1 Tax=Thermohahella caldifontis TaxID=3142973 RepID=A0AB39UXK0_9GAMM
MPSLYLRLDLSAEQLQRLYREPVQVVRAVSEDGRRIQFPVNAIRPYIRRDGVHGRFELVFDERYKLVDFRPA